MVRCADGTLYTVLPAAADSSLLPFGAVTTPDEDPGTPGIQVSAHGGVLQFTVDYPVANGVALVIAASREGTALASKVLPLRP